MPAPLQQQQNWHIQPARELLSQLHSGKNPFASNPSSPGKEFIEQLGLGLFAKISERVLTYAGPEVKSPVQAALKFRKVLEEIKFLESPHQKALTALAVKMAHEEFGTDDKLVTLEARFKELGELMAGGAGSDAEIESDTAKPQLPPGVTQEQARLEIDKRRMVNALMQGCARKFQWKYLVSDEIDAVSPDLKARYGTMLSLGDYQYWAFGDEEIGRMLAAAGGAPMAAVSRLDISTRPPTVCGHGISFPWILHELGKGILELLALHSLPKDEQLRNYVLAHADGVEKESWDLRIGPGFWDKFNRACLGAKVQLDEEDAKSVGELKNWPLIRSLLFKELVSQPAKDFHRMTKEILSGTEKGTDTLSGWARRLVRRWGTGEGQD